ncbi:MAG: hypothetical protein C0415_05635 [Thermodesulfovibrio sp.]|nr:hypothetical protein [Thermodesulfovibrio sp.]
MKKLIAIVVAVIFVLGFASMTFAAEKAAGKALDKCVKCHKGEKALDKVVAAKKYDSADALVKAVKANQKGAKAHAKHTDDDLKAAAKELKLK